MYEERVVMGGARMLEMRLAHDLKYVLRLCEGRKVLVEYCGGETGHVRRARGRETAYEFRSVEQLRYDFERDAEVT